MHAEDIIQLFESADIKKLDSFFVDEGLSLIRTHRQNNRGISVEEGDEINTVYTWEPGTECIQPPFNSIHFHKWREDDSSNILEMQPNGETFHRLMNELESNKKFKKSYLRRQERKDRRFLNPENKINFDFMHRQDVNLTMPDVHHYCIIVLRNYYAYKR